MNLIPKTDVEDQKHDVNITISNTTSSCSVNCGNGTKTTTIVSCKGQQSSEANKFRIDDSLECSSSFIETECQGDDSNCPGMYYLSRTKLKFC